MNTVVYTIILYNYELLVRIKSAVRCILLEDEFVALQKPIHINKQNNRSDVKIVWGNSRSSVRHGVRIQIALAKTINTQ